MKRTVVLLIITAVFLSACTNTKWVRTNVDKQRDFIVTLEQQEEGVTVLQQYEHPYEIDLANLEELMGDLIYTKKVGLMNKKKQNPVFQAVEIDRLAPLLVDSLAKADANQRIRFTSFNLGDAILFSDSRKTEGVLFVGSSGRLNIAFNYINSKRHPSETSASDHIYSNINPLQIQTSEKTILPSVPYAELHKFESGKQAPMWVVADLERLRETISTATLPIVKVTKEVSPVDSIKTGTVATPVIISEPIKTGTIATPVIISEPIPVPENLLEEEIKDKLKFIKELLDEGLITEKDYNAKKNELLDKID
jgi:hypothetical protein